ncbi:phospholipase D-like domain-containing protein [Bradyrhizobium sp. dw_78]|uniref:phospholipase D-like domain-containing protein n=1 Tax=Bradyrhizobium sp. dw_78 TaxID=2719793 RepID=UPI001BD60B3B|nr:phospholipase D-like domain-containing protein [Bradyrhizobium sp. dw_78]
MSMDVKVYDNGDHTCVVWLPVDGKPIPQCRGFTIHRLLKNDAKSTENYLHGFVGFSDDDTLDAAAPWKFALQRYMWWDYGVSPGDVVQYSVVPVVGPDKDHLQLSTAAASALTPPMTVSGRATSNVSAYFNKGIVAAQWVSRALGALGKNPKIADLIADTRPPHDGLPGNALRNELSGLLRLQLLAMLDEVKSNNGEIYAALYELNDPELLDRLKALGQKCHLILANGAFRPPANDENKQVRAQLKGVVDLHNRLVTGRHFAHNKFVVCCDAKGKPQRVLSGSTNWTMTGLCTQANNGIIVDDPDLAADFLAEWNLLKDAGNAYPPSLAAANSKAKTFQIDGGAITQWFAPTRVGEDLDYARQLINAAKQGILFLFFNPGAFVAPGKPEEKWTLLQNILFRHHQGTANFDDGLYIRGVVNQEIANLTTESKGKAGPSTHAALDPSSGTPVTLFKGGKQPPQHLGYESMVPKNIKDVFHNWATEILGAGVHIHSKVIVLDPFGDKPVVMTGSHNLGYKASTANDDNLMIIEGNAPLAAAYAVNIIAIYQAYRWNAYVEAHRQDPKVWHGLVDNDSWQDSFLAGEDLAEIRFWLGLHQPAAGMTVASSVAGVPVHTTPVADDGGPAPGKTSSAKKTTGARKKASVKKKPVKKAAARKKAPAKRKAPAKKKKAATKNKRAAKAKKAKKSNRR